MDNFTKAYIECALWSSHDESTPEGGEPMDQNYCADDLAPETLTAIEAECAAFQAENESDLSPHEPERGGIDFWLTRNGHGAGFWDGHWPEPQASRLDAAAKAAGERDLYVGDDGLIHQHPA